MSSGKDAYYFAHDSNAKDDPKCVLLIEQLGVEGYGIFWVLIETLRDQPNHKYPVANIPALARRYNTTTEKVRAVIYGYELFVIEEDLFFYSESLNRRMAEYNSLRSKRSESGRLGNAKRWGISQCDRNAIAERSQLVAKKGEESKVKESKGIVKGDSSSEQPPKRTAKRFTPPSFDEVSEYITQKGYTINPQSFIDFYESNGWRVSKNPMKSWQAALSSWNSRGDGNRGSTLQTPQKAQQYDEL